MADNDAGTAVRPWRNFAPVLVFSTPSLLAVFGSIAFAVFAHLFHYSRSDENAFVQFVAAQLDNSAVAMYFLGPFFFGVAALIGIWTIAFGRQSHTEKKWIGIVLFAALFATWLAYKLSRG